ncbi:sensor histidine kinase [Schaalia sp. 19OD2882]|uniref:ATP-binding protein n=1 Tax=Schaalia sp. 19OD2882 TaxID=2794089 RepID=UPI001C1E990D|nr:ATP-binding protein [Schaalia sp. 19OD2882]QWW20247.1 sensor histidine kinase [Schaalia sp. 19OD2882]
MRKRAVRMILSAVTVVALLLGIPGALAASVLQWRTEQMNLDSRALSLLRAVDRRIQTTGSVPESLVEAWALPLDEDEPDVYALVRTIDAGDHTVGSPVQDPVLVATAHSASATVRLEVSAVGTIQRIIRTCALFLSGMIASMAVGWMMANRLSRRLSAPLIYLSAQAEQIGSGQVRARLRPSGIEEIDLVQEELVRTGERMAGRLAAERQFAADASHQLRTPLTALSMRLEEIELISTEAEVQEEARSCLEQVERLTDVVSELLDPSKRAGGTTTAIHLLEVFNDLREEWEPQFDKAGRALIFTDEAGVPVLADGAKLGQVLATLIENALRYGADTVRVIARSSANKRGVVIDVSDEGAGVGAELVPDLFEYGVSGHGSTGIGLALAKDLAAAMGGRLELAQNAPPVFRVSLAAVPASLDPDRIMPMGPLVSMGRRSRRF